MRAGLSEGDAGRGQGRDAETAERARLVQVVQLALGKAGARLARRIRALRGDLDRIEGAGALSGRAQLFVAEAARAPRGATKIAAVDWSSGEAVEIELPLDPARPAKEQIDAIFVRARRLKNGAPIARARLRDAEQALSALEALGARLAVDLEVDLDALVAQARDIAPRDFAPPQATGRQPAKKQDSPAPPYRTFLGASGAPILVGRGAAHNDALTLHVARPHHLWLHAKGQVGAHVVVPLAKGVTCPADLLVEAAHLAAHFSRARDEGVVEITYVPKRHVRKPRGSPPGLVVVAREKVLVLRRSDAVIRRLLDRELAT